MKVVSQGTPTKWQVSICLFSLAILLYQQVKYTSSANVQLLDIKVFFFCIIILMQQNILI